jgi:hypothetical protein
MYDSANIRKVMLSELGPAATWVLNDSPIRLLLTAKGIDTHPWYFVQDRPKNAQTTGKLSLIDCAVASASAPTYFKPWTMQVAGQSTVMVDGGVGVTGNPVYEACVEAFCFDDLDPASTRVVSLGTGSYPPGNQVPSGLLGWMQWTVTTLLDAPEDQQTELVDRHWPNVMQRFDWQLPQAIDMADTGSIDMLVQICSKVAAQMDWKIILSS